MTSAEQYVQSVEAALRPLADSGRAVAMTAYMKDHFPFLGIPSTPRRAALKALPKPSPYDVPAIFASLWALEEREFHYTALDILERAAKKLDAAMTLDQVEAFTQTKTWWDSVDVFAGIASDILHRNPNLRDIVWRWSEHPNFWVNRLAILHQNGWKRDTDPAILFKLALDHADSDQFFIRKAIGWALRDYAWVEAAAVQGFVSENRTKLSPLTVREALKNVGSGRV